MAMQFGHTFSKRRKFDMGNSGFRWLTATEARYKLLLGFFRAMAFRIRVYAPLAYQPKGLFRSVDPPPEIRHLAFSIRESMSQVVVNRYINENMKAGYFADRLVIVAALPKSASAVIADCIAAIQSESGGVGIRRPTRYMHANHDPDLRPELVQDFPQGGVFKHHPRATGKNLRVLDLLGVKYVILLRHPVDQLVAYYCFILDKTNPLLKDAIRKDTWVYDYMYPLNWRLFQDGVSPNETIQYMIRDGYLNAILSWITDWLRFRDVNRSLVVRYEDFMTKRRETLNNISNFLYGRELDEKTLMKCNSIAEGHATRKRSDADNTRKYPYGWTGKIGIWKTYFSEENKRDYLSVVKKFLDYYPNASLILEAYPNLLDIDGL